VAAWTTSVPEVERLGLGAVSSNSSIDGLAMPDPDHDDEQLPVPD